MVKKVQAIKHQPLLAAKTGIDTEQLLNDLHYQQSRQIIQSLLNKGLISTDEFKQIDTLNKELFPSLLGPENVDTSMI